MVPPRPAQRRGPLERAATLSWRFLLVVAALVVLGIVLARLSLIVVPLVVALLIAVAVTPAASWAARRGIPQTLAAALVYVGVIAAIAALVAVFAPGFVTQFSHLGVALRQSTRDLREWLVKGPFGLSPSAAEDAFTMAREQVTRRGGLLGASILSGATLALKLVAGALLALFLSFFFVRDGARLWGWTLRMTPAPRRDDLDAIGRRAVRVLGSYLWGSAAQGAIEAAIIGLTLLVLGVPLVLPLTLLQFAAAFFPLVGAVDSGCGRRARDARERRLHPRLDRVGGGDPGEPARRQHPGAARSGPGRAPAPRRRAGGADRRRCRSVA